MRNIDLFLQEDFYQHGVMQYVPWNPAAAPHIVIFGATGTGKTYATKLMLGRISLTAVLISLRRHH